MSRLEQLFKKLGYNRNNGLFYLTEVDLWFHKFPYRISRVLRDVMKPDVFFNLSHFSNSRDSEHPEPLNNPFILFFDKPMDEVKNEIPKWTFSFGQAPVIIINSDDFEPLEIYHGYNFAGDERKLLHKIEAEELDFHINKLILGKTWQKFYSKYFKNTPRVDKFLLQNISDARRILIAKNMGGLYPKTANRLIGRLLFIRYLIDRNVSFESEDYIKEGEKLERRKSLLSLLGDKNRTYEFFHSIIKKFNGDLFPLSRKDNSGGFIKEESEVEQRHLNVMYHLFACSSFFKTGKDFEGYMVQPSFFDIYDFDVIPVELISNIYENFLGKAKTNENRIDNIEAFSKSRQKEIKAYYTPPFLVDYILSQTVTPHLERQSEASCKVLDPACGSGIFLVETLRKIIEKEMSVNPLLGANNERLWQLVRENIFGIDIDNEAIEIAIFSIYITLLDYKKPKEIKEFNFEKLKDINLFGGKEADFFNENHPFNEKFKKKVELDFIFGNPPWGIIEASQYNEYIKNRDKREKQENPEKYVKLEIGNREISQAFVIRASDFIMPNKKTKCVFIMSGKNLYNKLKPAKNWRNYLLSKFNLTQVFELSGVNNKIAGGNQLFEAVRQPAAIISYFAADKNEDTSTNIVRHITARPNRFFNFFKTIVIEKHDVKKVQQKYFMESKGGYDWLWKVLLHGNILDFYFIKRLKEQFLTFQQIIDKFNLKINGGLKTIDNQIKPENRKSTKIIQDWKFLDVESNKEFRPFQLAPTKTWGQKAEELALQSDKIYDDMKVGYLPDIYFFEGKKLLFKKGLEAGNNFQAVAAFSESDLVFTSTVCSVKPDKSIDYNPDIDSVLKNIAGLLNSQLFTYFVICSSSSVGVDRTRADFEEFFSFPISLNKQIGDLTIEIQNAYEKLREDPLNDNLQKELENYKEKLTESILNEYHIWENDQEKALIDYAINISIPVLKREEGKKNKSNNIFKDLKIRDQEDKKYLEEYANVFVDHFGKRFNDENKYFIVDIHIANEFIGFHFRLAKKPATGERVFFKIDENEIEMINKIGNLGIYYLSRNLFVQQDIRGFNKDSFYIIKPNERKVWHKAVAYADLSEFVNELVKAEIGKKRLTVKV